MPRMRLPSAPPAGKAPTPTIPSPPAGYPTELKDRYAIAAHIAALAVGDVDEDMIADYYEGAKAVLRFVPLAELTEGHPDHNVRVISREKRYAKLPASTRPPIVIQNGEIEDGNHRYRVAKAAGETGLWCYDVVDEEEGDPL